MLSKLLSKPLVVAGVLYLMSPWSTSSVCRSQSHLPIGRENFSLADQFAVKPETLTRGADTALPPLLGPSLRYGIDTSTSPCANFDKYVNGGWREKMDFSKDSLRRLNNRQFFSDTYERAEVRLHRLLDSVRAVALTTPDPRLRVLGTYYESCITADRLERVPVRVKSASDEIQDTSRVGQCRQRVMTVLGDAWGQVFANDLFTGDVLSRMQALLDAIHVAAIAQVKKNPWMNAQEKTIAVERLNKLQLRVGMPKASLDFTELILSPTAYHENKTAIANFRNRTWLTTIGEDGRNRWEMSLLLPNALYSSMTHAIEVPAVMFMPPFFQSTEEDALNFAAIGMIIAHEVFHSIAGQLPTIESSEIKENITRLKAIYTGMKALDNWVPNGDRTFDEDVADIGGVRVAYDAWKATIKSTRKPPIPMRDGYTPDQRFFVALARAWRAKWRPDAAQNTDVHSPPFARVNGMVMHMPEFAKAFGCKAGDPMVLSAEKRAVIW